MALVDDAFVPALCEAVPELRHYSTDSGLPFRSAKVPSLRLCLHTGFDREPAILNFRSALLYTPPVSPLDGINGKVSVLPTLVPPLSEVKTANFWKCSIYTLMQERQPLSLYTCLKAIVAKTNMHYGDKNFNVAG